MCALAAAAAAIRFMAIVAAYIGRYPAITFAKHSRKFAALAAAAAAADDRYDGISVCLFVWLACVHTYLRTYVRG